MSDDTANTNTDLYNIRGRIAKNRQELQHSNSKYLELNAMIDNMKSVLDQVEERFKALSDSLSDVVLRVNEIEKNQLTFSDVKSQITEFSSAELQPVLNELCDDIENAISEVKLVKQKQCQLLQFQKLEEDVTCVDVRSASSAGKSLVKPLQLQKKPRF